MVFLLALYGYIYIPYILDAGFSGINLSVFYPQLIIPGLFLFFYIIVRYRVKTAFKSDTFLHHPKQLLINEDGIFMESYRSSFHPAWKDVYRYNITKHAIYIYVAEIKAFIIPMRYLNDADKTTLTEFLKTNVNTRNYARQKQKGRILTIVLFAVAIGIGVFTGLTGGNDTNEKLQKAFEFDNSSNYTEAIKVYSKLIKEQPDVASYRLYRAQSEMKSGNFTGAVIDCEEAIRLQPKDGYAYYIYSYALYNAGKPEEACKAINTSIQFGYAKTTKPFCE